MTDRESFIRAICDQPDDDAPRLVLADWLDEHGESERAEFIRVQCEIDRLLSITERWARTPSNQPGGSAEDGGPAGAALAEAQNLQRRERELFEQSTMTHSWFGAAYELVKAGDDWWATLRWFRRGFIESVTCTAADWITHADAILREHPVQEVRLTTWPTIISVDDWELKKFGESARFDFYGKAREMLKDRWPTVKTWHLPEQTIGTVEVDAYLLRALHGDPSHPTPRGVVNYRSR